MDHLDDHMTSIHDFSHFVVAAVDPPSESITKKFFKIGIQCAAKKPQEEAQY